MILTPTKTKTKTTRTTTNISLRLLHKQSIILLLIFLLLTLSQCDNNNNNRLLQQTQTQTQTLQKSRKNLYKLSDNQILTISFSRPIKINLIHNKTLQTLQRIQKIQRLEKSSSSMLTHTITTNHQKQSIQSLQYQNIKNTKKWNITITLKAIQGNNVCYFTPINGFKIKTDLIQQQLYKQTQKQTQKQIQSDNNINQPDNYFIPQTQAQTSQAYNNNNNNNYNNNKQNYIRQYLQLKQGTNILNSQILKQYLQKQYHSYNAYHIQSILNGLFSVVCLPIPSPKLKQSKIVIKYGYPQNQIKSIKMKQIENIKVYKNQIGSKVYKLLIDQNQDYIIRITRKKGLPLIKLYQCQQDIEGVRQGQRFKQAQQCYQQHNIVPTAITSQQQHPKNPYLKYIITNMLTKTQQYIGTTKTTNTNKNTNKKCKNCSLYLSVQIKQQNYTEVQIIILPSTYVYRLVENQILKEDLIAGAVKKYEIQLKANRYAERDTERDRDDIEQKIEEKIKVNIQVYQGEISAVFREGSGGRGSWEYSPMQTTGVISVQIPISIFKQQPSKKTQKYPSTSPSPSTSTSPSPTSTSSPSFPISTSLSLQIKSLNKDTTYSIVYSQGQYQINIKDGHPTTHIIDPMQNILFYYINEQIKNIPMYLSFNVNNSKVLDKIDIRIYYYVYVQEDEEGKDGNDKNKNKDMDIKHMGNRNRKMNRIQYLPKKLTQSYSNIQASSIILQLPDKHPKLQISFLNTHPQPIQLTLTINDQQIIFLPLSPALSLSHPPLPLQIPKNSKINLYIDNNQQGFIQLTIKKCDQSYPQISYSLTSQDFINNIYDYQSLGQSQRITKSTIKIKKDGGLYVSIHGDGISNSFIQISARYIQIDRKKILQNQYNIRYNNNNRDIDYQLLTNSKVEVWFKELECYGGSGGSGIGVSGGSNTNANTNNANVNVNKNTKQCKQNIVYQYYISKDRSDLYREMICPGVFMYRNTDDDDDEGGDDEKEKEKNKDSIVGIGLNSQSNNNINNNIVNSNTHPNTNPTPNTNHPNSIHKTRTAKLYPSKPSKFLTRSSDGIIQFKQTLDQNIIYINIKATNIKTKQQFIYKDIQIITFYGQISRMSTEFLFITGGTLGMIGVILFFIVRRQARMGYIAVRTKDSQGGRNRRDKEREKDKNKDKGKEKQKQKQKQEDQIIDSIQLIKSN